MALATPAAIAKQQMKGMPAGRYVCAMVDYGDGMHVGENYRVYTDREARETRKNASEFYGTVTTITIK